MIIDNKYNPEKHIWEGWRVIDFIESLYPSIKSQMGDNSFRKPFTNREELKEFCMYEQPYYKKYIKEVVDYFADLYNLK